MSSSARKHRIIREAAVPDDPDITISMFDVDAIYRAVALACACQITGQNKDHTKAIAVADDFLEYIDPLADNPRAHQQAAKRK